MTYATAPSLQKYSLVPQKCGWLCAWNSHNTRSQTNEMTKDLLYFTNTIFYCFTNFNNSGRDFDILQAHSRLHVSSVMLSSPKWPVVCRVGR